MDTYVIPSRRSGSTTEISLNMSAFYVQPNFSLGSWDTKSSCTCVDLLGTEKAPTSALSTCYLRALFHELARNNPELKSNPTTKSWSKFRIKRFLSKRPLAHLVGDMMSAHQCHFGTLWLFPWCFPWCCMLTVIHVVAHAKAAVQCFGGSNFATNHSCIPSSCCHMLAQLTSVSAKVWQG